MSLRLNLGCGTKHFDGFCNVDAQSEFNPDVIADMRNMPEFKDAGAELIVLEHSIEHVWTGDVPAIVGECYRILQPGGSLIVTTPDLRALCLAWLRKRIDTQIFCTNLYGGYRGHPEDLHRWLYDAETLCAALSIKPWKELKTFDNRPLSETVRLAADFWILSVEAVK